MDNGTVPRDPNPYDDKLENPDAGERPELSDWDAPTAESDGYDLAADDVVTAKKPVVERIKSAATAVKAQADAHPLAGVGLAALAGIGAGVGAGMLAARAKRNA